MKKFNVVLSTACIALIISIILIIVGSNNKYDIKISNQFSNSTASTTLTCEFKESSGFYKIKNEDFIRHVAGGDKNGKPIRLTFIDIDSVNPKVDYNVKLQNGTEMIDKVVAKKTEHYIFIADTIGGEPVFYTIFPSQKVAVWQQTTTNGPEGEIATSFDSMGFCH